MFACFAFCPISHTREITMLIPLLILVCSGLAFGEETETTTVTDNSTTIGEETITVENEQTTKTDEVTTSMESTNATEPSTNATEPVSTDKTTLANSDDISTKAPNHAFQSFVSIKLISLCVALMYCSNWIELKLQKIYNINSNLIKFNWFNWFVL